MITDKEFINDEVNLILDKDYEVNSLWIYIKEIKDYDFKLWRKLILFWRENEKKRWEDRVQKAFKQYLVTEEIIKLNTKIDQDLIPKFK